MLLASEWVSKDGGLYVLSAVMKLLRLVFELVLVDFVILQHGFSWVDQVLDRVVVAGILI